MLKVIQRYFTCEGRFNMVYQYHIMLLLHFTSKEVMNLTFYLFRSIGKMVDRVQYKSKQVDTSVFHSVLIKMLVMEELKKTNNYLGNIPHCITFSAECYSHSTV
jgi:hypothetical protein